LNFSFGEYKTNVYLSKDIPTICQLALDLGLEAGRPSFNPLIIADENTSSIAAKLCDGWDLPFCIIKSGEENKNWQSVEKILAAAQTAGLGRDGIFIAVGGGVICDITAFAASIYKRGCSIVLVSTTLLGMVDASIGGKTGFDIFDIKNLIGSFYPAQTVYMPVISLNTLPQREWKSGMAELIKTAILSGDDFLDQITEKADLLKDYTKLAESDILRKCIEKAVLYKGSIVSEDPKEISGKRMLLNLGHTFGHALESTAGLGVISHGEAVAWGITRACELGEKLQITPALRAKKIKDLLLSFGYECTNIHPLASNTNALLNVMKSDKKKKQGKITFIVPDEKSACTVILNSESEMEILNNLFL